MASEQASQSSLDQIKSVPSGVGAALGHAPSLSQDQLSKPIHVSLQLEARKLPNLDTRGKSDPFVILYEKSHHDSNSNAETWQEIARTETVYNNLNPKWSRTFKVDYQFGTTTTLRFSVYDRDSKDEDLSKHDYIGEVRCTVAQLVLADNQRLVAQINNKNAKPGARTGTLIIRAEEQQGDLGDNVTFQFAATGLRRGRKPFYVLSSKNRNDEDFSPVVYSEVHRAYAGANHVTTFKPITKPLARVTNGDMNRELEVRFMDYDRGGNHFRGGSVRFTLKAVRSAIATSSPARFTLKKKRSNGHVIEAGVLIVNKCEISVPFTFIDYIRSGVEMKTVIAIDMSATNGSPLDPRSLHHNQGENEYMIALREVGNVLPAYDTSQRFRAFGLGASLAPKWEETVHCFPLLGPNGHPVCDDVNGVIEAYRKALLYTVAPFLPCRYGPLLKHVIEMTREANTKHGAISYTVMLLFTDGDFADFADVANLICDGAELPLSIVIVGVGNSRFLKLERLDGDEERLCSTEGIPCARDIVQFVQFHKHRYNPTQLAREVLDEIPDQIVSYMRSKGLKPSDITPLREISSQAPSASEKHPYLPGSIVHSSQSTGSGVLGSDMSHITDSPGHGHGQSSSCTQPSNGAIAKIPTSNSSPYPAVPVPIPDVSAPSANFHQQSMAPPITSPGLQSVPSSGGVPTTNVPAPGTSFHHQHMAPPITSPGLQSVPSSGGVPTTNVPAPGTSFHHQHMAPTITSPGLQSVPSSGGVPTTNVPAPGTSFHHQPMVPPIPGLGLQTVPSSGAEPVLPSSQLNMPTKPPNEAQQLLHIQPLGPSQPHTPQPQHPLKSQPGPHESSTYGLMQGHPPRYLGGYGGHGHVHGEPHLLQQQHGVASSHYSQPSPYGHTPGSHSQHHPPPHRYRPNPYHYPYPAQYGGTYNHVPHSDMPSTYSAYPVSSQSHPYPPSSSPVPFLEMPYPGQQNGPNYPSR